MASDKKNALRCGKCGCSTSSLFAVRDSLGNRTWLCPKCLAVHRRKVAR